MKMYTVLGGVCLMICYAGFTRDSPVIVGLAGLSFIIVLLAAAGDRG